MKSPKDGKKPGATGPERMAVDPKRAEDLRESARQGGEADANFGLAVVVFLLGYAAYVLVSRLL